MILIKPSYEIVQCPTGEEALYYIERAARTCYKSEGKIDVSMFEATIAQSDNPDEERTEVKKIIRYAKSARDLVAKLIVRNHDAMIEFGGLLHVIFIVDRGVSHELVRHRLASFAQESTRYCNYGNDKDISFIIPCWLETPEDSLIWKNAMFYDETWYNSLIKDYNWTPQQARSVLPNSLKTEINMSANLREWRHIFKQRCSPAAHPQMREVMIPLLHEMQAKIPLIFDDIKY